MSKCSLRISNTSCYCAVFSIITTSSYLTAAAAGLPFCKHLATMIPLRLSGVHGNSLTDLTFAVTEACGESIPDGRLDDIFSLSKK